MTLDHFACHSTLLYRFSSVQPNFFDQKKEHEQNWVRNFVQFLVKNATRWIRNSNPTGKFVLSSMNQWWTVPLRHNPSSAHAWQINWNHFFNWEEYFNNNAISNGDFKNHCTVQNCHSEQLWLKIVRKQLPTAKRTTTKPFRRKNDGAITTITKSQLYEQTL